MRHDLGLSKVQMGYVFSAFTIAYALFEIPSGAWGDRIGSRRVLTRIVIWWSSFTIATAAAFNYASLLAVRFLFGMGEAGAFPNASRTFSRWFPASERGTAQGIFFAGAHLGGGLTPILVGALLNFLPWRLVFVSLRNGRLRLGVGLVPLVPGRTGRSSRRQRAGAETHRIGPRTEPVASTRRRRAAPDPRRSECDPALFDVFHPGIRLLLQHHLAPDLPEGGPRLLRVPLDLLAGLPLILSAVADLLGGLATDRLTRLHGLRAGRCWIGGLALLVGGDRA